MNVNVYGRRLTGTRVRSSRVTCPAPGRRHRTLAPEGAVAKITGKEGLRFSGPARVYDSEEDMLHALERKEIGRGDVIVIRYEGPFRETDRDP